MLWPQIPTAPRSSHATNPCEASKTKSRAVRSTVGHVSRLGRATMFTIIELDPCHLELLTLLWPLTSMEQREAYVVQGELAQDHPFPSSASPLFRRTPSPSFSTLFTCHKGWNIWHAYKPADRSAQNAVPRAWVQT